VLDEHVEFLERALVEQKLDALARGQLAAGVLRLDALLAAAEFGAGAPFFEGIQDVFHLLPPVDWPMAAAVLTRPFSEPETRPFPGIWYRLPERHISALALNAN
jgi:hypothetical protein